MREEEERKKIAEEEKRRVEQIEADRRLAENLLKQEEEEWKQRYSMGNPSNTDTNGTVHFSEVSVLFLD